MRHRDPIFTKRTKEFIFHVSPMSYQKRLFIGLFSTLFVIIFGGIYIYRTVISSNFNISQIVISIMVTFALIALPIYVLWQTQRSDKTD
jgi:cytochrome b subunit of formate dehydrogenase